jgi:predicted ATPase
MMLALLAEGHKRAGEAGGGLERLAEALVFVDETGERFYEAEIHRLQGELLLVQGDTGRAEASFQRAIEVACQQGAKSWQLRAVMSLSRLWQTLNKQEQARHLLGETYSWFTEGFDTPDLREAKALLEELS